MIKRVYVDNSVIGGVTDTVFAEDSKKLMDEFRRGLYIPVVSNLTLEELRGAPQDVLSTFNELRDIFEFVEVSVDALRLSRQYLSDGQFTPRMRNDTVHIAAASVHRVDILVSWNFRDIVNLNKIVVYNSVNMKLGYPIIEIRSPREIIHA